MSQGMFEPIRRMTNRPRGLFVCGTDTGVGKTVVTAAVAALLHRAGRRVGVLKPYASGCERKNGRLISEDAEILRRAAGEIWSHDQVAPVCYEAPMAPAAAAEVSPPQLLNSGGIIASIVQTMDEQAEACDFLLVEGIGGPMVPLDDRHTMLDLAQAVGYPVVLVTRGSLGTLSHTAMAVEVIRGRKLVLAGLVVNRLRATSGGLEANNLKWLEKQNRLPVLAALPEINVGADFPETIPAEFLSTLQGPNWLELGGR